MSDSMSSLARAREFAGRARERMARFRENAEEAIGYGIQHAEVGAVTFGAGFANERYGKPNAHGDMEVSVAGVPVDLGAAVAVIGVSFAGGLGKQVAHGHNVGSALLGSYAGRMGRQMGRAALQKHNETPAQVTSGNPYGQQWGQDRQNAYAGDE